MTRDSDTRRMAETGTGDWRPVCNFPDYSVSSAGEIYSHRSRRVLSPYLVKGYQRVGLHGGGKRKIVSVHVIVAEAFHGLRPNGMQCAHLDGNSTNNEAANLAWVSKRENEAHKALHGTACIGEKSPHAKLTNAQAAIIRKAVKGRITRREAAIVAGVSDDVVEGLLDRGTYRPNGQSPNSNAIPSSDLDALVEDLWSSDQANTLTNQAARAITSLRNQLTASKARERELREALEEVTDYAGSLTGALWKAEDQSCIKRARTALTNTESHHGS